MTDGFDSIPWHDTELVEFSVDRRNSGARDEVRLSVIWPHGGGATLVFRDCYAMKAEMNFGVIADELILSASLLEDDPGLTLIRERWKPLGVSLDHLHCYRLELSSSSSVIRIYATEFSIE